MNATKRMVMAVSMLFMFVFASVAAAQDKPQKASGSDAVRSAIDATNAKFTAALKAGDIPKLTAVYTDDAMLLAPGAPVLKGRAAIAELFTGWLSEMSVTDFSLTTGEVVVAGEYAIETGAYAMTMAPKSGGAAMPDKGKYLVVWKRDGDSWKLYRDVWNSDSGPHSK
jgi:uncharacterized protein (TIGR02246 family)